jgi:hypothetical protein
MHVQRIWLNGVWFNGPLYASLLILEGLVKLLSRHRTLVGFLRNGGDGFPVGASFSSPSCLPHRLLKLALPGGQKCDTHPTYAGEKEAEKVVV